MSVVKIQLISLKTQRIMRVLCIPIMLVLCGNFALYYFILFKQSGPNTLSMKIVMTITFFPMGCFITILHGYELLDEYFRQRIINRQDHPVSWASLYLGLLLIFMALITLTDRFIWPS